MHCWLAHVVGDRRMHVGGSLQSHVVRPGRRLRQLPTARFRLRPSWFSVMIAAPPPSLVVGHRREVPPPSNHTLMRLGDVDAAPCALVCGGGVCVVCVGHAHGWCGRGLQPHHLQQVFARRRRTTSYAIPSSRWGCAGRACLGLVGVPVSPPAPDSSVLRMRSPNDRS